MDMSLGKLWELVMLSNHIILCPLLLPSVLTSIRVFSSKSALCIRWSKYLSFSISPSNEYAYSELISFRINWSSCSPRDSQESSPTPQFKSINSSALSFLYGPALTSIHDYWKNHSFDWMHLCWQSNVSSKHLSISWLQSPSAVILEPPNIKSLTVSIVSTSVCHEVMGPDAMIFIF